MNLLSHTKKLKKQNQLSRNLLIYPTFRIYTQHSIKIATNVRNNTSGGHFNALKRIKKMNGKLQTSTYPAIRSILKKKKKSFLILEECIRMMPVYNSLLFLTYRCTREKPKCQKP